jgi:serine/threonine protein kinase
VALSDDLNTDPAFTKTIISANSNVSADSTTGGNLRSGAEDVTIGTIIAERYQIEKMLGRGGMASVYQVRHITLDKRFALKILHRSRELDDASVLRFQHEAKGLAALKHPNLVSISDFGLSEAGLPYCAMDLVIGRPLSDVIHDMKSPEYKQLTRIFGEVCSALIYAHDQNIVHRDLKPSNIIICEEQDGKWYPKLIDFGIARFGDSKEKWLTQHGEIFGTPYYMSPEQCAGQVIDLRSDIYSLGCTMYEAYVGRPPFIAESGLQTIAMHTNDEPARPGSLRKDLPPDLEKIMLRCLAKEPVNRYQSASELRRDLAKADLRTKSEKIKQRTVISGIVILCVVAIAAVTMWQSRDQLSNDPQEIVKVLDADSLAARIQKAKNVPGFSRTSLSAMYIQLMRLKASDREECLKLGQEGYDLLVVDTTEALNDFSYYSWSVASALGYQYFLELNLSKAAKCEEAAIKIFDKVEVSHGEFKMSPELLEDLNIILAYYASQPKIDSEMIRTLISKGKSIWSQIEAAENGRRLKVDGYMAAKIFFEMGERCEGCGSISNAADCYRLAATIYRKIDKQSESNAAENKISEMLKKRIR